MATRALSHDLDNAYIRHLLPKIKGYEKQDKGTIEWFLSLGIAQASTVAEHAVASVGGREVVSEDSHDISDGSDVKLVSVREHSSGTRYDAGVRNFKNKTGDLLVIVYERITERFYYFRIPHSAYSNVTEVEIPFNLDGSPQRHVRVSSHYSYTRKQRWWKYERATFEEMVLTEVLHLAGTNFEKPLQEMGFSEAWLVLDGENIAERHNREQKLSWLLNQGVEFSERKGGWAFKHKPQAIEFMVEWKCGTT